MTVPAFIHEVPRPVARYVIEGAPRTKKTHQRIARRRDGSRFILPAKTSCAWANLAVLQLQTQRHRQPKMPDGAKLNLRALVYRDRDVGDTIGYLQNICDALQAAGVVTNDKFIAAFDGTRPLVDRRRPRVELALTVLDEG